MIVRNSPPMAMIKNRIFYNVIKFYFALYLANNTFCLSHNWSFNPFYDHHIFWDLAFLCPRDIPLQSASNKVNCKIKKDMVFQLGVSYHMLGRILHTHIQYWILDIEGQDFALGFPVPSSYIK